jgi:hypothetical protein
VNGATGFVQVLDLQLPFASAVKIQFKLLLPKLNFAVIDPAVAGFRHLGALEFHLEFAILGFFKQQFGNFNKLVMPLLGRF